MGLKIYKRQLYELYIFAMSNEYVVSQYTESELLNILNLNNPTDRELEAKILSMIKKYTNIGNDSGNRLAKFFEDIYDFFFEPDEPDETNVQEGLITLKDMQGIGGNVQTKVYGNLLSSPQIDWGNIQIPDNGDLYKLGGYDNAFALNSAPTDNIYQVNGIMGNVNTGSVVTPAKDNLQLTRPLDYSKDSLNPLLKQTIKRIISIDSQYRDQKSITPTTSFTFNLSEPLKDVVSLSLYSIQIPYTWYTINSDFGGNFFYLKGDASGINNGNHDYKISVPSGNYTPSALAAAVNTGINSAMSVHTDVSFGNTKIIYNNNNTSDSGTGKCSLQIDIKKVYNEQCYELTFPTFTHPLDASNRIYSIPGYLGFNNTSYYCSSINSNPI